MARPKSSPGGDDADDKARMRAAARRLEALLKDAGPNIIVTPIIDRTAKSEPAEPVVPAVAELAEVPGVEPLTIATPGRAPSAASDVAKPAAEKSVASPEAKAPTTAPPTAKTKTPTPPAAARLRSEKRSSTATPAIQRKPAVERPLPVAAAAPVNKPLPASGRGELFDAINASRRQFIATGAFSFVINILMLAGPLFMLQVYDRVMTSGSLPTLVTLTIMTAVLYVITGLLELVRTRVIVRVGTEIDQRIGDRIFRASLRRSLTSQGASTSALRELDGMRQFLAGPGPLTFFDAPWTPVYLLVIFAVHWTLGLAATLGAAVLLALAWASERQSREPLTEAGKAAGRSLELAETGQRNAEALTAMGMVGTYRARWQGANGEALAWQIRAADKIGSYSALSKMLRLLLQSLMLALGAALALAGLISAGSIIAATIIFGRALAPVEQAIGHWRGFLKARECYAKLDDLLRREPEPKPRTALPAPKGRLEVVGLRVSAPDTRQLILSNVAFAVEPGQMLAVIGPSASGKSTLARTLVGLWPPFAGAVKLDDARLDQWDTEALGRHIGYLPQNVELFAGTVKENIARFTPEASDEGIVAAAKQAHAHELILALPQGYETQLGAFATYLSSGQRQRIALARALYGHPALVVLDEPNSNLDRAGDEALSQAIDG
ncbi:MAG: type I secretion system permease/ATPase, partial [Hyphomicrobium sp.]